MVQTLPVVAVALNTRNLPKFDLTPVRLEVNPPLYDTVCERVQAIIWWKLLQASTARPPSNRFGSVRGGEGTMNVGMIGKLECDVFLKQVLEPGFLDKREVFVDVVLSGGQEVWDLQLGTQPRFG